MKLISFLNKRAREALYLLVSLPITIFLFVGVIIGLTASTVIPISILVFLFLLTVMEKVAKFEVMRSNKILKTDFRVVENWYSYPVFSWDGVKERVTSIRAWMAISYVFIAFGWSLFSFVLVVFGIAGLAVIVFSLGIASLSTFSQNFQIEDNGDFFKGNIAYDGTLKEFKLEFGDLTDSGIVTWSFPSLWYFLLGLAALVLAIWVIPRNTRAMAQMTEGLLSGNFLPRIQHEISKVLSKHGKKISERDVRLAMDKAGDKKELSELSQREREILSLMAQGKSNSGIAKTLYLTEGSVEKHISNILSKLGLPVEEASHRRVLAVLKYLGIDPKNGSMPE